MDDIDERLDKIEDTLHSIELELQTICTILANHGEGLGRLRATQLALKGLLTLNRQESDSG